MNDRIIFNNKEEIITYIRDFGAIKAGFEEYDFMWVANIFMATVDNLMEYSLPIEIEEFGQHLDDEEREFIFNLARYLENYSQR